MSEEGPAAVYAERERRFTAEAERHAARSRLVSNLRGLSFGTLVVALLFALFGKSPQTSSSVALVALVLFVLLLIWHARVIAAEDMARRYARVNTDGVRRQSGRFRELAENGATYADANHPYVDDLDVFGHGSLFQFLCTAHTRAGLDILADYLRSKSATPVIEARQAAVRELAPKLDLRQRLEALSLGVVDSGPKRRETPNPEPLLKWAESEPTLSKSAVVVWAARILPIITLGCVVLSWKFGAPAWLWASSLLLPLVLIVRTRDTTTYVFQAVSETQGAFLRYGTLLRELETATVEAPLLRSLKERLAEGGVLPSAAMRRFSRAVGFFELRHNGLIHPIANLFLLWDIHCVFALENWQRGAGRRARDWFAVIGEVEALSSLAGLCHDEPAFAFPELSASAKFVAKDLSHPLIERSQRIGNDIDLASGGSALLVTGSNMSGKSTLLRSMGLASVLAFAGGPVCARRLVLAPLRIVTSIRVSDSLERGVSHFYAEIAKLKTAVECAKGAEPAFFLLDEILHGTNSRERQIGARWVLAELLRSGALGAVSTHDMGLCELSPELMQHVTMIHFRESIHDGQMTFDYKAYPGPVQAGNALRLMRQVGLEVPLQ